MTPRLDSRTNAQEAAGPSFDELVERLSELVEAGEMERAHEFIEASPEHAERLLALLPAISALASFEHAPAEAPAEAFDPSRCLGDFRLVREIGRGGMGVVYEAEQLSLSRHVAVKVLPFAAMLDERQRARFKNEARAAASLHHAHIVPVFYVGAERGVHYYAMQYIEGQSLAQVVGELRIADCGSRIAECVEGMPSVESAIRNPKSAIETLRDGHAAPTIPSRNCPAHFRSIAELGIQAATALHYAHESGVVHRDIKPSNLLIDPQGHLWVADFGLARIGADPTVTLTGDLIGTLRYMSPEQLRGRSTMIDHRTDVYSLGVTLYELATLRPAFAADEREQLMRQILDEELPAPRMVCPAMPADLETIILKATRKDAELRYATAQELADDLDRFRAAKPILARRPTLVDRLLAWSRRNVALVSGASVALAAIVAVCIAATILTLRAYRAETRQRERAEGNLLLAAESIDRMLTRVAGDHRAAGDLKRAETLAVDATEFYEKLLRRGDDPDLVFQAAAAYEQIAVIWTLVEQYEKAAGAHRRSKELLTPLAVPSGRAEHQAAMAENYRGQAEIALSLHRGEGAEAPCLHALAIYEQLARQFPEDPKYDVWVAETLANLGTIAWMTNRPDEAEVFFSRATAIETAMPERLKALPAYWDSRGATLNNWGQLVRDRGEYDRALRMFEESLALQRRACEALNVDPVQHSCYRLAYWNIAATHAEAKDFARAEEALERLIAACPGYMDTYHDSAALLLECSKHVDEAQAEVFRGRARELLALGLNAPAQSQQARQSLAWLLANCDDQSFRDPAQARRLAEQVVAEAPERGAAWYTLAWAQYRSGDWTAAETALDKAVRHSAEGRATADDWLLLAMIRWQQGQTPEAGKWLDKARDSIAAGRDDGERLAALVDESAELMTPAGADYLKSPISDESPSYPGDTP